MLAQASMGAPAKGSWGSYQAWWAGGNRKQGLMRLALRYDLSARTLVSQHGVPKSGLWKDFSGAPAAAKAAAGYLFPELFRLKRVQAFLVGGRLARGLRRAS